MPAMPHILVVEDDREISALLARHLPESEADLLVLVLRRRCSGDRCRCDGCRRDACASAPPKTMLFDGWTLDLGLRLLSDPTGAIVAVTGAEFELLRVFCELPGRILSREQLLDRTQGRQAGERSIDVLVSRLRRKIEPDPRDPQRIKTVRSGGYVFTAKVGSLPRMG